MNIRRLLGFGLLGAMLATTPLVISAQQTGVQKKGKRKGGKRGKKGGKAGKGQQRKKGGGGDE